MGEKRCTYTLHGAQQIYVYGEQRIIKSSAIGATNVEEIEWLTENMLQFSADWKEKGWGYMCCIGEMNPVTPEESLALIELHKQLETANCKGIAFVNPAAFVVGVQAKKHQKKSRAAYKEKHFKSEEEAMEWLESLFSE